MSAYVVSFTPGFKRKPFKRIDVLDSPIDGASRGHSNLELKLRKQRSELSPRRGSASAPVVTRSHRGPDPVHGFFLSTGGGGGFERSTGCERSTTGLSAGLVTFSSGLSGGKSFSLMSIILTSAPNLRYPRNRISFRVCSVWPRS